MQVRVEKIQIVLLLIFFKVESLEAKWKTSVTEVENSRKAFLELTEALDAQKRQQWEDEEQDALQEGGDALSVYGVRLQEGLCPVELVTMS